MVTARLVKSLSWTEKELPQKDRTKHVHSIHQYLGKFVPQLVEYFLKRDLKNSKLICDPFMGSGTTLIESNIRGIPSIGLDISKFNIMLCNVKINNYHVDKLRKETNAIFNNTLEQMSKYSMNNFLSEKTKKKLGYTDSKYLENWFHPEALKALLIFKENIPKYKYQDVLKIILSRSARSSRMIMHYEVDYPKHPQSKDYFCLKHDRICHPTKNAIAFLKRYCQDTVNRIEAFQTLRNDVYTKTIHGDSSKYDFSKLNINDVFTSPPYIGLIDYHEQHRYAYELLGMADNSKSEIGSKKNGSSKIAISKYKKSVSKTLKNITESSFARNGSVIIVVNDKLDLYDDIISDSHMYIKKKLCREVNRRSGRRATRFNEHILVCKPNGHK